MECEPAVVKVAAHVALPVDTSTAAVPHPLIAVPPSVNATVPPDKATGEVGLTVAVRVTCWFSPAVPVDVTATVVVALFTVCDKAVLVLAAYVVVSPE